MKAADRVRLGTLTDEGIRRAVARGRHLRREFITASIEALRRRIHSRIRALFGASARLSADSALGPHTGPTNSADKNLPTVKVSAERGTQEQRYRCTA